MKLYANILPLKTMPFAKLQSLGPAQIDLVGSSTFTVYVDDEIKGDIEKVRVAASKYVLGMLSPEIQGIIMDTQTESLYNLVVR